jgi:hypothetical protein
VWCFPNGKTTGTQQKKTAEHPSVVVVVVAVVVISILLGSLHLPLPSSSTDCFVCFVLFGTIIVGTPSLLLPLPSSSSLSSTDCLVRHNNNNNTTADYSTSRRLQYGTVLYRTFIKFINIIKYCSAAKVQ